MALMTLMILLEPSSSPDMRPYRGKWKIALSAANASPSRLTP